MNKMLYLIDNNKIEIKEIKIEEIENKKMLSSYNSPKYVAFDNKKGFYKNSIASTPTLDKFEFIITALGKYLGINISNNYIILDNYNNIIGSISETVLKDNEELYEFQSPKLNEIFDLENQEILNILTKFKSLPRDTILDNPDDIFYVLDLFPNIIKHLSLNNNNEKIINEFYKMIFFDLITGNQDRNLKNFALIKDLNNNLRFSPLFDSSTINLHNEEGNFRNILGFRIKDEDIMDYLYNYRYDVIEPILNLIENEEQIKEIINNISSYILNDNEKKWINSRIFHNLKGINEYRKTNIKT